MCEIRPVRQLQAVVPVVCKERVAEVNVGVQEHCPQVKLERPGAAICSTNLLLTFQTSDAGVRGAS